MRHIHFLKGLKIILSKDQKFSFTEALPGGLHTSKCYKSPNLQAWSKYSYVIESGKHSNHISSRKTVSIELRSVWNISVYSKM